MAAVNPLVITSGGDFQRIQATDNLDPLLLSTARTLAGSRTALGLAIGTDVQAWDADLDALAALSATAGMLARTGANTFAVRTITGTASNISVTNGTGASANPTIDLATVTQGSTGTSFVKVQMDSFGRVINNTAVVSGDISALVDARYLQLSGGTLTGALTLAADPASALQAATKQYVDGLVTGLQIKPTAKVATTAVLPTVTYANGTAGVGATLTASANGVLTIDGYATALNDLILVKDQASAFQNGLYTVTTAGAAGAAFVLTRHADMDQAAEFSGGFIPVGSTGTTNGNSLWLANPSGTVTVGTTNIPFTELNKAADLVAGNGITFSANTVSASLAARLAFNGTTIDLASGIVTPGTYTKITVDTYGRATAGATATPADIGAQASDAGLTSLAALTGGGIVAATATDTFIMRSIATASSSRITVTNGDGVSGNPTLDLATTGVGANTYNSVTVDTYGRVTAGSTTSSESATTTLTNAEAGAIVIGQVVYAFTTSGQVKKANANAASTFRAVAIVADASISASASGNFTQSGVQVATTAQWDAVTGQTGGLTSGSRYFLDNTTAGKLTTTVPSTGWVVPVGVALSTTRLDLQMLQPVQL